MSDPQTPKTTAPASDMTAATGSIEPPRPDPKPAAASADSPMGDVQRTTLQALSREAGVPFDDTLSTAAAARRITELQRAKDRDNEAARAARGAATEALPPDAGEEDPGAALDAPGTKQAMQGEEQAAERKKPAAQ